MTGGIDGLGEIKIGISIAQSERLALSNSAADLPDPETRRSRSS